ncbi:hypothetical protein [uncultured Roseobacter sp.]|uniref:hypothetical protein n=1 Tax=uncultured Roseobacter sp. TaxID=114847 RepID=UPI00261925D1|nr:hypothetical protein [uncultured Roseobacter sp.]
MLAIAAIAFWVYVRYVSARAPETGIDPLFIAFETILSALAVGLVLVFIQKIGERYSVEERIRELKDTIESEREELEFRMDDIRRRTENALQLKFGHGLDGIAEDPNELEHIQRLKEGHVYWLNTLFRDAERNMVAILEAVKQGTHVNLLMMSPFSDYAEIRGRYTAPDFSNPASVESNKESYGKQLAASFSFMLTHYEQYERLKQETPGIGELNIRFYDDPAGLPILIVKSGDVMEAYSGFYLNSVSSQMPYIKWSETIGGEAFIKNLEDYFERKWYFAADNGLEDIRERVRAKKPELLDQEVVADIAPT